MSEPIGPGDWVECVDARPHRRITVAPITIVFGALYRVAKVIPGGTRDYAALRFWEQDCLRVEGDPLPEPNAWRFVRFRPIYRLKQSIIEALKAPVTRTPQVLQQIREEQNA